jgi:hypothetical protein
VEAGDGVVDDDSRTGIFERSRIRPDVDPETDVLKLSFLYFRCAAKMFMSLSSYLHLVPFPLVDLVG